MSYEAPDPPLNAWKAQLSRKLGCNPENATLIPALTVARTYPKNTVCWVAVKGIHHPIPITRHMARPSPDAVEEHMRVPIPGANGLYLQYTPEIGLNRVPGACVHYMDYQGVFGTPTPCRDGVFYDTWRRLPFAPERLGPNSVSVVVRAFLTERDAENALLEASP